MNCTKCGYIYEKYNSNICPLCGIVNRPTKTIIAVIIVAVIGGVFVANFGMVTEEATAFVEEDNAAKELEIESEIHRLVNSQRLQKGVPQLEYDDEIAIIAKAHSLDMATRDYVEHINPEGKDAIQRSLDAGYDCNIMDGDTLLHYGLSENIYHVEYNTFTIMESPGSIAKDAVDGWMSSTAHKKGLLEDIATSEGLGVTLTEYDVYVTQNLC